jgi:hypothetical protein
MDREQRLLPVLALVTGLAWMAAVLLIAANPKGVTLAGDLAYDRANRVHTLALVLLLATALLAYRAIRAGGLPGVRAAKALVIAAALMLAGNTIGFWGALVAGEPSESFWGGWGGWVGWLTFLPGLLLLLVALVVLGRAARRWPDVTRAQRWSLPLAGLFLVTTTETWAISPAATLVPAALAAFALLAAGTAVAQATAAAQPAAATPSAHADHPTG